MVIGDRLLEMEAKLLGAEGCRTILDKALAEARDVEAEALLIATDLQLTRFAENVIHQNVAEANATLTVRVAAGRRQGRATTNDLSGAGIRAAVQTARDFALGAPSAPDFPGLPEPGPAQFASGFDEATAGCGPEARAQAAGAACRLAAEAGLIAAGAFRTGRREYAVRSTRGVDAYHAGTLADFVVTVMSEASAGRGQESGWRVGGLDVERAIRDACDTAQRGRAPRALPPGEYPVVLDAAATFDLAHMLATNGMSAQSVQEGQSWMNGRQGQQALSAGVSIWDDGCDPAGVPLPFDVEGVARQRLNVVEAGVVGEAAHDSETAARAGRASTGHAAPPEYRRWRTGPLPLNLFVRPGQASLPSMIAGVGRGLYVRRFWYTRLAQARDCVVTGMTRDGLFWIENGEIAYPVKNLRFTQSYVDALARVEAVGEEACLLMDDYGFATSVPALKVAGWRFTGTTA